MLNSSHFFVFRSFLATPVFPWNPNFLRFAAVAMAPSSAKVKAEYAKSGRSTCKSCSKAIASGSLRLGLVTRDPRGFDAPRWHHWDCFPFNSKSFSSAKDIEGFASLKCSDQETLKKFVSESRGSQKEVLDIDGDSVEGRAGITNKTRKAYLADDDKEEGRNLKKGKLSSSIEVGQTVATFSTSEIMDKYKDASLPPKWKAFQTIIFLERDDGLHDSAKVAAFDFDGCLAKTSVKKVGADAWSLMYSSIPEKLQSLYIDGFKLVVFSNESNIDKWSKKRQVAVDSKIGRLEQFIKHVKVPIQVFIACGLSYAKPEDPFRKPKPGMWLIMEQLFNSGIAIDMDQSFYVGDAAGRENDHSDADIQFAKAVGLKFFLPEEYFNN